MTGHDVTITFNHMSSAQSQTEIVTAQLQGILGLHCDKRLERSNYLVTLYNFVLTGQLQFPWGIESELSVM